jgi:DNA-binding transcriptional regulator PaaX
MYMSEEEGYIEKLKDFLSSDTKEAKIATVALCVFAVASLPVLVMGASVVGNAMQCFKMFNGSKKYSSRQIRSAVESIKRQKLVEYVRDKDGKTVVKITKKGKAKLRAFSIDLIEIKKPKKWDGKWRLVMFDIPMRFTKGREALRYHLKELNFFQFQKSAWIYHYPCEDEIIFIADFFGVGKYVEILTVESVLRDGELKKHFHLS